MLLDPLYQSKVAWSIAAGIVKYFAEGQSQEEPGAKANDDVIKTFQQEPGEFIPAP